MYMGRHVRGILALALVALIVGAILFVRKPAPARAAPHLATIGELTDAELRYGLAPIDDPTVVYQPDVVIVRGGAGAIRSAGADGMTWTLDPSAPGADRIRPGVVMLVTGRAVGRVLRAEPGTAGLQVVVGPVDLGELLLESDIHLDLAFDPGMAIAYVLPDLPGASVELDPTPVSGRNGVEASAEGRLIRASLSAPPDVRPQPKPTPAAQTPGVVTRLGFNLVPVVGKDGVGLRATAGVQGIRLAAEMAFDVKTPRLRGVISGRDAYLKLEGAAGVRMQFDAAGTVGRTNVNETFPLPIDWDLPIVASPVPLSVKIQQEFSVRTGFGSTGALSARGGFGLDGAFEVGIIKGKFELFGPGFGAYDSFLRSTQGVTLAPAGLTLGHQVRVMVGLGVAGFAAGPYVGLRSSVAIREGSAIGLVHCRGASLAVNLIGGVGYSLPGLVVRAVNAVLSLFNLAPIKGSGGVNVADKQIFNRTEEASQSKICTQ